jgi:hypothetical protein
MMVLSTSAAQEGARTRFVATWALADVGGEGALIERLGPSPVGILVYDALENMCVQIMNREHHNLRLDNDHDFKLALQSYVAYFGKYTLNISEQSVTHHVLGSLYPADVGCDFKRNYQFAGDNLILTAEGLIGGEQIAAQLIWKRIR